MKVTGRGLSLSLLIILGFAAVFPVYALSAPVYNRLGGTTQYDTAARIAAEGWSSADTAIIAVGTVGNSYDALAAGPLAVEKNAPILLTEGNQLPSATRTALTELHVKSVYLVGGTGVIKPTVEDAIRALGIAVTRLAGNDAAETSVQIAQEMGGNPTEIVLAGGKGQDALSVASIAAAQGMPILYSGNKDALPSSVATYLNSIKDRVTTSYIIGGPGVISEKQAAALPGQKERIYGESAYDTNSAVIQQFAPALNFDDIYLANGQTMVDALAGVPLAAERKAPLVLTDNTAVKAADFINGRTNDQCRVTALGGNAVVSQAMLEVLVAPSTPPVSPPVYGYPIIVDSFKAIDHQTLQVVFSRSVAVPTSIRWDVQRGGTLLSGLKAEWSQDNTVLSLSPGSKLAQGQYSFTVSGGEISPGQDTVNCVVITQSDANYSIKDLPTLAGFKDFPPDSTEVYAQEIKIQAITGNQQSYDIASGDILSVTSSDDQVAKVAQEKDQWYIAGGDVAAGGNTADKSAVITVQLSTLDGIKTIRHTVKVSPQQPEVQTLKVGYDRITDGMDADRLPEQAYFEFASAEAARIGTKIGVYGKDQYGVWSDILPSPDQVAVTDSSCGPRYSFVIQEDKTCACAGPVPHLLQLNVNESTVVKNQEIKVDIHYEKGTAEITVKILAL